MSIDLSDAQASITEFFHTNPCTLYAPLKINDHGVVTTSYVEAAVTTCHYKDATAANDAPVNLQELGEPVHGFVKLPYGTEVGKDWRIVALGRRFRVVYVAPLPQFALETKVGVVDVSGEPTE